MLIVIHIETFLQSKLIVKPHSITSVQTLKGNGHKTGQQKQKGLFVFWQLKKQQPGLSRNHKVRD